MYYLSIEPQEKCLPMGSKLGGGSVTLYFEIKLKEEKKKTKEKKEKQKGKRIKDCISSIIHKLRIFNL